jgi:hypothetical protein
MLQKNLKLNRKITGVKKILQQVPKKNIKIEAMKS